MRDPSKKCCSWIRISRDDTRRVRTSLDVRAQRAGRTCSPVAKRSVASIIAGSEVQFLPEGFAPFRSSAVEHATPRKGWSRLECSPAYTRSVVKTSVTSPVTRGGRVQIPQGFGPKLIG